MLLRDPAAKGCPVGRRCPPQRGSQAIENTLIYVARFFWFVALFVAPDRKSNRQTSASKPRFLVTSCLPSRLMAQSTRSRSHGMAQKALKFNEDMTVWPDEIGMLLPIGLRNNNGLKGPPPAPLRA